MRRFAPKASTAKRAVYSHWQREQLNELKSDSTAHDKRPAMAAQQLKRQRARGRERERARQREESTTKEQHNLLFINAMCVTQRSHEQ